MEQEAHRVLLAHQSGYTRATTGIDGTCIGHVGCRPPVHHEICTSGGVCGLLYPYDDDPTK